MDPGRLEALGALRAKIAIELYCRPSKSEDGELEELTM
jgi:hypothetical protein